MAIYLDNAATSHPKPEAVYREVDRVLREVGASPGRGGHRLALESTRLLFEARQGLAEFLHIPEATRIAFTAGATEAINTALFGLLKPGDRVVTSTMEHNAVTRPLRALQDRGVVVTKVPADRQGFVCPEAIREACRERTRLVALTHCSNVTGTLQPIEEIGPWCRREGILFMVDAAQSAGLFPLDVQGMGIDLLAAPGHKGLLGPQGTGLLYVREGLELTPLVFGGTGGNSQSDLPPEELPERLEAGTLNAPGLAGLNAGVKFLSEVGLSRVRQHEQELLARLIAGLDEIPGVVIYGPREPQHHGGAISFNIKERDPSEVAFLLDQDHGVYVRSGLHCSPDAHRTIGTFPRGTVRLSPGYFNTTEEIDHVLTAVANLASHPSRG